MGQNKSASPKPTPLQIPAKTLTDDPWRRNITWTVEFEKKLLHEIKDLNPRVKPKLLTVGPVGAGKSSFISSIKSIGKGRKYGMTMTGVTGDSSCTADFEEYTDADVLKKYNLMDTMGVEPSNKRGFYVDDIVFLVKGNIRVGYKFNPIASISAKSRDFNLNPTITDRCHCAIFVLSATSIDAGIQSEYVDKIKQLLNKIREENIPQILILSKVDEICEEVEKDIRMIFRSIKVKKVLKEASELFGIEQSSIHPVKNYAVDITVDNCTNIPLLIALKQAMEYAADNVEYLLNNEI